MHMLTDINSLKLLERMEKNMELGLGAYTQAWQGHLGPNSRLLPLLS